MISVIYMIVIVYLCQILVRNKLKYIFFVLISVNNWSFNVINIVKAKPESSSCGHLKNVI
jgi:hypothetical protein